MGKHDLKNELASYDKKQLIGLISDLYDKNKSVREYLDHLIKLDDETILKEYKTKIKKSFFSKNGSYNLVTGKKAIGDFRKLDTSISSLIDLMLYYVECGIQFTKNFGDINEKFYVSLERTYGDALLLIEKNNLHDQFKDKAKQIYLNADNIGWGLIEVLGDYYHEIFPEV